MKTHRYRIAVDVTNQAAQRQIDFRTGVHTNVPIAVVIIERRVYVVAGRFDDFSNAAAIIPITSFM